MVLNIPFWVQNRWSKDFLKNTIGLNSLFWGQKASFKTVLGHILGFFRCYYNGYQVYNTPAVGEPQRYIYKMKKRLRKKKHVGEFKVFGVPFALRRNKKDDFDFFLDTFLEEAVEANGCYCAASGKDNEFEGFIELGRQKDIPEKRLENITIWIKSHPDIDKFIFGHTVDAWYGPFDELDEISKKI